MAPASRAFQMAPKHRRPFALHRSPVRVFVARGFGDKLFCVASYYFNTLIFVNSFPFWLLSAETFQNIWHGWLLRCLQRWSAYYFSRRKDFVNSSRKVDQSRDPTQLSCDLATSGRAQDNILAMPNVERRLEIGSLSLSWNYQWFGYVCANDIQLISIPFPCHSLIDNLTISNNYQKKKNIFAMLPILFFCIHPSSQFSFGINLYLFQFFSFSPLNFIFFGS